MNIIRAGAACCLVIGRERVTILMHICWQRRCAMRAATTMRRRTDAQIMCDEHHDGSRREDEVEHCRCGAQVLRQFCAAEVDVDQMLQVAGAFPSDAQLLPG